MGGWPKSNTEMSRLFTQPFGPKNALNPAATTTVVMMKGMVTKTFKNALPANRKRAKTYAMGSPTRKVMMVDNTACQIVKESGAQILLKTLVVNPWLLPTCQAILKVASSGWK